MSELMELLQTIHWIKAKAGTGCSLSTADEMQKLFREIEDVAGEALEEAHQTDLVAQAEQSMVGNMTAPWRDWEHGREMSPGVTNYDCGQHPNRNSGDRLDRTRNAEMPDYWRNNDGWYPEFGDEGSQQHDWAKVVVVFPNGFDELTQKTATRICEAEYPDEYRRFKARTRAIDVGDRSSPA
jgi:hypothetical protein